MAGRFITIEGIEGVGKTTNIAVIENFLKQKKVPYIVTREPGGTPFAEQIRNLLLSPREEVVDGNAELLLMFAARAQHIAQKIMPALAQNIWVVCDRFTDATYAYQGGGRGVSMEKIALLESLVQDQLKPDKVIILDAPVAIGLARVAKRGNLDRFEHEKAQFFERVRQVYLDRAAENPQRYTIVDAAQSIENVHLQVESVVAELVSCWACE